MRGAYVIGEPGTGKSTLVRALTADLDIEWRHRPFAHSVYFDSAYRVIAAQLGGDDARYPGTDRLSMSVQPKACDWIAGAPAPAVFAEGDRLATRGFFEAMEKACEAWWLVVLHADPAELDRRRDERGSAQDPAWLAGRRTKVERLAQAYEQRAFHVDAMAPVEQLATSLRAHPSFDFLNIS